MQTTGLKNIGASTVAQGLWRDMLRSYDQHQGAVLQQLPGPSCPEEGPASLLGSLTGSAYALRSYGETGVASQAVPARHSQEHSDGDGLVAMSRSVISGSRAASPSTRGCRGCVQAHLLRGAKPPILVGREGFITLKKTLYLFMIMTLLGVAFWWHHYQPTPPPPEAKNHALLQLHGVQFVDLDQRGGKVVIDVQQACKTQGDETLVCQQIQCRLYDAQQVLLAITAPLARALPKESLVHFVQPLEVILTDHGSLQASGGVLDYQTMTLTMEDVHSEWGVKPPGTLPQHQ